jgi:hypothetical protein
MPRRPSCPGAFLPDLLLVRSGMTESWTSGTSTLPLDLCRNPIPIPLKVSRIFTLRSSFYDPAYLDPSGLQYAGNYIPAWLCRYFGLLNLDDL